MPANEQMAEEWAHGHNSPFDKNCLTEILGWKIIQNIVSRSILQDQLNYLNYFI